MAHLWKLLNGLASNFLYLSELLGRYNGHSEATEHHLGFYIFTIHFFLGWGGSRWVSPCSP